jgi:glutaredoxin-like protein
MALLREEDVAKLREIFTERLKGDVTLVHYTQVASKLIVPGAAICPACEDTRQLLEELAETSEHISLEIHDFGAEVDELAKVGITEIPATIVNGATFTGRVRYFGVPSGYEFASLIEDIIDAGAGASDLAPETEAALKGLSKDVHILVFVTPTCPYCPSAVRMAHKLAMASDRVVGDMIEANEFPELSQRYNVMAVPKIVINETTSFEGAVPEAAFLEKVLEAVAK